MSLTDRLDTTLGRFRGVFSGSPLRRVVLGSLAAVAVVSALYYPVGMVLTHKINDDATYETPDQFRVAGGSRAVAMVEALIDREVNKTPWVANDPWFLPGAALDNMPNYQQGMMYAMGRFTIDLVEQIGRARGSSRMDVDLEKAQSRIKYDGTTWVWDPKVSLMPQSSAEAQYRSALEGLRSYNERVARKEATFDTRADNLIAAIDRITNDLGASLGAIDDGIEDIGGIFDTNADDTFYAAKGRVYAYYMILRELGKDFDQIIKEKNLGAVWGNMLSTLKHAAEMHPLVVSNTDPSDMLFNTHLASQGYYINMARTQLFEVRDILIK